MNMNLESVCWVSMHAPGQRSPRLQLATIERPHTTPSSIPSLPHFHTGHSLRARSPSSSDKSSGLRSPWSTESPRPSSIESPRASSIDSPRRNTRTQSGSHSSRADSPLLVEQGACGHRAELLAPTWMSASFSSIIKDISSAYGATGPMLRKLENERLLQDRMITSRNHRKLQEKQEASLRPLPNDTRVDARCTLRGYGHAITAQSVPQATEPDPEYLSRLASPRQQYRANRGNFVTPGPGSYSPTLAHKPSPPSISSIKDREERLKPPEDGSPGPMYYPPCSGSPCRFTHPDKIHSPTRSPSHSPTASRPTSRSSTRSPRSATRSPSRPPSRSPARPFTNVRQHSPVDEVPHAPRPIHPNTDLNRSSGSACMGVDMGARAGSGIAPGLAVAAEPEAAEEAAETEAAPEAE